MAKEEQLAAPFGLGGTTPQFFELEAAIGEYEDPRHLYDKCQALRALYESRTTGETVVRQGAMQMPIATVSYKEDELQLQLSADDNGTFLLANPNSRGSSGVAIKDGVIVQLAGEERDMDAVSRESKKLLLLYAKSVGVPSKLIKDDSFVYRILEELPGQDSASRAETWLRRTKAVASAIGRLFLRQENLFVGKNNYGNVTKKKTHGKLSPEDIASQQANGQVLQRSRRKPRVAGLVLTALVLPNPFNFDDSSTTAGITYPQPLIANGLDNWVNRSEHIREGFDSRGFELPFESTTAFFGEDAVPVLPVEDPSILPEGLTDAPALNASSREIKNGDNNFDPNRSDYPFGITQDIYGGIRHVTNLHEARDNDELPPGAYATLDVRVDPGDAVKIIDLDNNGLAIQVGTTIKIYNNSERPISLDQLQNVYVQVVDNP